MWRDQVGMANHYYFVGRDMLPTAELCLFRGGTAAAQKASKHQWDITLYFTDRDGRICNKGTAYNKSIWPPHERKVYRLSHGSGKWIVAWPAAAQTKSMRREWTFHLNRLTEKRRHAKAMLRKTLKYDRNCKHNVDITQSNKTSTHRSRGYDIFVNCNWDDTRWQ